MSVRERSEGVRLSKWLHNFGGSTGDDLKLYEASVEIVTRNSGAPRLKTPSESLRAHFKRSSASLAIGQDTCTKRVELESRGHEHAIVKMRRKFFTDLGKHAVRYAMQEFELM